MTVAIVRLAEEFTCIVPSAPDGLCNALRGELATRSRLTADFKLICLVLDHTIMLQFCAETILSAAKPIDWAM